MSAARRVFVAMPFTQEFRDVYQYGIKRACDAVGAECIRVDEQIFVDGILDRIYGEIDSADLVIGEMSLHNPNVYYEIGYAKGRRKKVLLLARTAEDIPFDLRPYRHVIYDGRIEKLEEMLARNIRELLDSTSDLGPREIAGLWVGTVVAEHPNPKFAETLIEMEFRWAGRVEGLGSIRAGEHIIHLRFVGDFEHDRFLMLTYRGESKAIMQFGAALLRLDGVGDLLEGRYLGYGALHDAVVYGRLTLARQSRFANPR
jgi:hypothetical protein